MERTADEGRRRRSALREWFRHRRRDFPWRTKPEPWSVFVAEMLLRRTRAAQVQQYLPGILASFPDAASMARAPIKLVRERLRPLGLTWRADSLKAAAEVITLEMAGEVPLTPEGLMKLPGVGPYVAFSTLAALTNADVVLTDTNTVRVALRVTGVEPRGDVRRRKATREAIRDVLGGPAPAADWWAVLDLAANTCRARAPLCPVCPIQPLCSTGRTADRATLPGAAR